MLDQEFSPRNFRTIFDIENRKGNYLEDRFFPDIEILTKRIKSAKSNVKESLRAKKRLEARNLQAPSAQLERLIVLAERRLSRRYNKLSDLKTQKNLKLDETFQELSNAVSSGKVNIALSQRTLPSGKIVYSLADAPQTFFPAKQIQYNLYKTFHCAQSNRNQTLIQLLRCLEDKYEKLVVRTDITDFYESVSRTKLNSILAKNNRLSIISKNVISGILGNYSALSGNADGLPRGVGISAYLSEIYMASFDKFMFDLPDVLFYTRYVDDIIIVFDKRIENRGTDNKYIDFIKAQLSKLDLSINTKKTEISNFPQPGKDFDYLGYRFSKEKNKIRLDISKQRLDRYKAKIDRVFEVYDKRKHTNEKRARKELILRLHFLTKNTHLANNKRKAMIGIYFSNELLTSERSLKVLDGHLARNIAKLPYKSLKLRARKFSFLKGFRYRIYMKFSTKQLSNIVRAWKHGI